MTSTSVFTPMTQADLLAAADRLDREGQHDLAAEARVEAGAPSVTPVAPVRSVPCDDCGRPVGVVRNMPDDWPFDWWSHALNGRPCGRRA